MRNRLRILTAFLACGLFFAAGSQAWAGDFQMRLCVIDEASNPVVGATISSPDLAGALVTDATGCTFVNSVSATATATATVTPPTGSMLLPTTETFPMVEGTTFTFTLLAAPPPPTDPPVTPTEVPITPTEVPVTPTEVPVTPDAGTGSLQIVKADCVIDAPLVTQGDATLDASDCEMGHATFALYLYGDGTDAVVATAETHNGWTELLLAPGDYVIVEDGTWAQTTVTVTDGAVTWVVFHNPSADTPAAPAPTTSPPTSGTTAPPAPAKVTSLPSTGSGEHYGSGILLIGTAGVILMATGVMLSGRRRTL